MQNLELQSLGSESVTRIAASATQFTMNVRDTMMFCVSELMMDDIFTPLQCYGSNFTLYQVIMQLLASRAQVL